MTKPISTMEHGMLDCVLAGTLLTLPRRLGWESRLRGALTAMALGTLGYSLMTRYQLGLVKLLPMRTHLLMDGIGGALLAGSPLLLRRKRADIVAALLGLGASEMAIAALTKTRPPLMVQIEPAINLPTPVAKPVNDAINNGLAALRSR